MKRFAATQMNTCMTTDASACTIAPAVCCAQPALNTVLDTAFLAVSIFVTLISLIILKISAMISIFGLIMVLVFLVCSILLINRSNNFTVFPAGRESGDR